MKKITILLILFGLILSFGLTAELLAQNRFTELNTTAGGQGVLRQPRLGDEQIRQVRVDLRRNGDAYLEIESDRSRYSFQGRWSEAITDSINLNINRGFDNRTVFASGKVYLRRGELDRVEFEGRVGGDVFGVSFTARRGFGGQGGQGGYNSGGYNNQNPGNRNYANEIVRRAIEDQLFRERRENVEVVLDQAESYFAGNGEESVRGTGRVRIGNREWQSIRFDATVDSRQGRTTRLNYDFNNNNPGNSGAAFREGRYEIRLVNTGRLLDIGNDGLTVQQTSGRDTRTQQWDIESAGNGYYYIRSAETGRVMTAGGNGGSGSTVIVSELRRGQDNQLWEVVPGPDNGFYFISRLGKALDSPSSARFEGGRMQVYNRNGEANQRFQLRLITYTPDRGGYDRPGSGGGGSGGGYGNNRGSGSVRWRGRVDDVVRLELRGNSIIERAISGTSYNNGTYTFSSPMPRRDLSLTLDRRKVRGSIEILERPSFSNNFTTVIEIRDSQGGAADYEFELRWN